MSASGFVSRAACGGRRPTQFSAHVAHERPALVTRLLKNRDVARFIVAPSGYGKTCLAIEYAETIHAWGNVFWFNAQSPCFVRDLDAKVIASACLSVNPDAALVVFDDIPELDMGRQELLSEEIDKLLAEGCEVIVTCLPTCDMVSALQRDRLRMRADALLLDDAELDGSRAADERARQPSAQISPVQRIPLLVWSTESDCGTRFVKGLLGEELPSDVLLAMCSMLVLGEGTVAGLASIGPFDEAVLEEICGDYPHFRVNADSARFEATPLDVEILATPMRRHMHRIAARSTPGSPDKLARAWASALLAHGRPMRSCAVMLEICPRSARADWLVENAFELARKACFYPALNLISAGEAGRGELKMRQDAFEAFCRCMLGDEEGAVRCAKRNAFSKEAPEGARVLSLLVATRLESGPIAERARKALEDEGGAAESDNLESCSNWALLAYAWRARCASISSLARFWLRLHEAAVGDMVQCVCASWLFRLHESLGEQFDPEIELALRQVVRFVRERLVECVTHDDIDFFTASAGLAMEEAHGRGMPFEAAIESGSLMLLRRVEMSVLSQRRQFEEQTRLEQARRSDWIATHPSSMLVKEAVAPVAISERNVPILALKLFGCFEVTIGGVPVEYSSFKRQNTRALLVLLAVNQGREVPRDAIAEAMWPRSSSRVAQKNFYTVWAHLRRALSLSDGTCPYLVRHQYGCSLDARFVQSDVERLDEICRELLFSAPNIEHWSHLFSELDRDFACDLMPSERKNALILQARSDYRSRMVDALVAATFGVISADNPQWGVWFARAAVARDETREDAYVALMRAQIAGNQRTAAMMTYLSCRKALSTHLGIDPSPETTALYESLLEGD